MKEQRPSRNVDHAPTSLAELRLEEETLDSVLGHIGRIGVEILEGWDAAGTTLVDGRRVATFGRTDERVAPIDQFQYDTWHGPCVSCLDGHVYYFDGESFEPEWRQFAEVAADHGVYSVVSFPLRVGDEVIGGLNFYSSERDALRSGQREEGALFAAQAAIAIANAQTLAEADEERAQLREALQTRMIIGQATGLLMAQEGMTSDEAFQRMVKVSQNANVKLRDVAKRYVEAWEARTEGETSKA